MQAESRREQCLLWVIHTYIFSLSMIKNRRISLFGTSSSVRSKTIKIIHSMKCRRSGTYKIKWNIKLKVYTPCHFLREPSSSGRFLFSWRVVLQKLEVYNVYQIKDFEPDVKKPCTVYVVFGSAAMKILSAMKVFCKLRYFILK